MNDELKKILKEVVALDSRYSPDALILGPDLSQNKIGSV
jgi:hypothetical protein